MTFRQLAIHLQALEQTRARLAITAQLAELLKELDPGSEVTLTCYLLQGGLLPPYQSLEFQLSTKLVLRVLARLAEAKGWSATEPATRPATAPTVATVGLFEAEPTVTETEVMLPMVARRYRQLGDLGQLTVEILGGEEAAATETGNAKSLLITTVYDQLVTIARSGGEGSQEQKQQLLFDLLNQLDPVAAKFVIRIILGKLRLGFSTLTLMDALSWAQHGDKRDREALELAYQKKADIGKLAAAYLAVPAAEALTALEEYQVEVGVPVTPALCQRLNTAAEIIEKMSLVYAEPKYDGLRIQIHVDIQTGLVKAFTRNLEEVTAMFPELQQVAGQLHCKSCILDSEAVGYDPATNKILSFQDTITRKRKYEVASRAETMPIRCFVFDVMAIDGESLVDTPLSERKARLAELLTDSATLVKTHYLETTDPEELRKFHEAQLGQGLEGVVAKQADSIYRSGRKGWRWVKIKEREGTSGKLSDTVDCIIMGYYLGRGKRTVFGVGAFLLGVLGEEAGTVVVQSVAKLGTGLTDVEFQNLRLVADQHRAAEMPASYRVPKGLLPDGWLEPSVVLEIAADEITQSPLHAAGVSLRFPRLVRVREDKNWEQATTVTELGEIQKSDSGL